MMFAQDKEIITHALGLNREPKPYRNRYCAMAGRQELEDMVRCGWLEHGELINNGRDQMYHVTEAGAAAVGSYLPE